MAAIVDELDEWSEDRSWEVTAGQCLDEEGRRTLTRAMVFLLADQEYRWKSIDDFPFLRKLFDRGREPGDPEVWPFYDRGELAVARVAPRAGR